MKAIDTEYCVFYQGNKCAALKKKYCFECPFCKTAKELEDGRNKAEKHIQRLPNRIRSKILDTYRFSDERTDNEVTGTE